MTFALAGGILLIIGALFTMMGQIRSAVMVYFVADMAWLGISYQTGDMLGTSMVSIGMLLGLIAFIKMETGKMRKNLDL